jgi:uncharacterized protein (DUF302 family)
MRFSAILGAGLLAAGAASAAVVEKPSPHSVAETIDRLEAAVGKAGASVVARVDHAGAAEKAGLEMRPAELLIFGNPKVGTPLMQAEMAMTVVLPLRVAAYEDVDGQVIVVYENIADVAEVYGVDPQSEAVTAIAGALDKLTGAAVAAD